MLSNYLITAWKVFLRRKFFTFVMLFGICITLTVLMIGASVFESALYPKGPEKNVDNYRAITRLVTYDNENDNTHFGRLGYAFIQNNIKRLASPELFSQYMNANEATIFHRALKSTFRVKKTDDKYWKILDFDFVQGRPFSADELAEGRTVAVINEHTQQRLFGEQSAINQSITIANVAYTVIGVVANVSVLEQHAESDIWLPYTSDTNSTQSSNDIGLWNVLLYHSDSSQLDLVSEEFKHMLQTDVILQEKNNRDTKNISVYSGAFSKIENLALEYFYDEYSYDAPVSLYISVATIVVLLFMLLPSINMVNLNISRIIERSSEIGVRRAFGASRSQLLGQFIFENILITLIGGILGVVFSMVILSAIESSGELAHHTFNFNLRVFFVGLLLILIFGLISGIYPAYKMSRLQVVNALKGSF